ncbi:MAG: phage regulatory CII family protein [Planctomycetota bacterium]
MQSYEVLREAADKVGVKALAADLRLSPALVYKWCEAAEADEPDGSGTRNPLDRVRDIVKVTGDLAVISWLCLQANGFFVHNPVADSKDIDADLLQSTQHMVQEFSELLNEVSRAVADDGAIANSEAERIRREWEQLKTTAETFVVACEKGVYRIAK